jgi:hypothetical protein
MMTRTTTILLALSICLLASPASADTGVGFSGEPTVTNPLKPTSEGLKALFATEKFDMQQSVGLTFGTGANRFSQHYLNTMTYKISEPLTIQATLGIQNQTLASGAYGSASGARLIVPNIGILYQPKPNLRIEFGFSNTPYGGSAYDSFWGRRGY